MKKILLSLVCIAGLSLAETTCSVSIEEKMATRCMSLGFSIRGICESLKPTIEAFQNNESIPEQKRIEIICKVNTMLFTMLFDDPRYFLLPEQEAKDLLVKRAEDMKTQVLWLIKG